MYVLLPTLLSANPVHFHHYQDRSDIPSNGPTPLSSEATTMAATNKTTAKVDLTEQLDITTLREQILSTSSSLTPED
jgi:hypothetical protein